mgnify:CR=1 FL=1
MAADCPSCRRLRHLERSLRRRRVPEPSPAAIERADSEQPVALDLTPLAERLGRPAKAIIQTLKQGRCPMLKVLE